MASIMVISNNYRKSLISTYFRFQDLGGLGAVRDQAKQNSSAQLGPAQRVQDTPGVCPGHLGEALRV